MSYTNGWIKPLVASDILLFTVIKDKLNILLIERLNEPYKGSWALPGGFVEGDESLEEAALRELNEETGIKDVYLEQFHTFGDVDRDPRGRVISVAFYALVANKKTTLRAASDAKEVRWFEVEHLPKLAFDHRLVIKLGLESLQSKITQSSMAMNLLPDRFKYSELQKVYEAILQKKLDKRNFRKKINSLDLLKETGIKEVDGAYRPSMLYTFKRKEVVFFS